MIDKNVPMDEYRNDLQLLHSILESPADIIIFALDTHYRYTVFSKFHKETMKSIWGVDIQTGMNMLDLISYPDDRQKAKNNFDRALSGDHFIINEAYGDDLLRRTFYENHYNSIKDADGNTVGVSVFVIDATERMLATNAVKEALVKAEAGNRLKTAFIQNISHEVRTPLNGILGFSEMLTQPNLSAKEKLHYNFLIKASSNRLMNTITDYMDISLIESGNVEINRQSYHVSEFVKNLQLKYQDLCTKKSIAFKIETPADDENLTMMGDQELLQKCISHLVDNAIKFTSEGSITMGYTVKQHTIEFFVKDTGIGIDPEAQERIFEPFVMENIDDTRGYEGNGLGLAITKGFLKLHGGKVRVESGKGQGASFYLSLPMKPGKKENPEPAPRMIKHAVSTHPVILIAEDDLYSDIYLDIVLKPIASVIFKACNGKEAVEMCRQHPEISLVLMDVKMPVMNGLEATREIKSFRKGLPVIAVTAYALSEDKRRAFEAGIDDFLTKPVSRLELLGKLKKFGFIR